MRKLILIILSSLISAPILADNSNEVWSTYHGSASHAGYSNTTVNADAIKPLWTRELTTPDNTQTILGEPVVTKNTLYIHTQNYNADNGSSYPDSLLALDTTNGATRWQHDFDLSIRTSAITYDNNKLYLMLSHRNDQGRKLTINNIQIAAFDPENGNTIFSVPAQLTNGLYSGWWFSQAPVLNNHQLFLGNVSMQLAANADTGQVEWYSGDVSGVENMAVVNQDYVMRFMNNAVGLLSRKTGELVTTIASADTGVWQQNIPLILNEQQNTAYAVFNSPTQLAAVDLNNKQLKWHLNIPDLVNKIVYANGMLYFIQLPNLLGPLSGKTTLYAVDANTGTVAWTLPINLEINGDMIVTNNVLLIYTVDSLLVISLDTHQIIKTIPTKGIGDLGYSYMAIANNTLYMTESRIDIGVQETMFVSAYALN